MFLAPGTSLSSDFVEAMDDLLINIFDQIMEQAKTICNMRLTAQGKKPKRSTIASEDIEGAVNVVFGNCSQLREYVYKMKFSSKF